MPIFGFFAARLYHRKALAVFMGINWIQFCALLAIPAIPSVRQGHISHPSAIIVYVLHLQVKLGVTWCSTRLFGLLRSCSDEDCATLARTHGNGIMRVRA